MHADLSNWWRFRTLVWLISQVPTLAVDPVCPILQFFWPPEGQKLSDSSKISISFYPTLIRCYLQVKSNLVERPRCYLAETIYFGNFRKFFGHQRAKNYQFFSGISISSCPTHFQCFPPVKSNLVEKSRFYWADTIYFGQFCKFFGHQRAKNYQIFLKFPLVLAQPTFNAFLLPKVI